MNALEEFKNHAYNGTKLECSIKTLALAYLQLHHKFGLHPDDHVDPGGGYCGWHVLLVDQVRCSLDNRPDEFDYPNWLTGDFINMLASFHVDDEDEIFRNMLLRLNSWFNDMDSDNLESVDSDLSSLAMYHEGAPDEVYEPLRDACEVIHWILEL